MYLWGAFICISVSSISNISVSQIYTSRHKSFISNDTNYSDKNYRNATLFSTNAAFAIQLRFNLGVNCQFSTPMSDFATVIMWIIERL